jgi:hypothetical protein
LFFCCPFVEGKNFHLSDFFERYYREESRESIQQTLGVEDEKSLNKPPTLGFHESIPNYVSTLMGQENSKVNIDSWDDDEFRNHTKDICAIMVYDARNKDLKDWR